MAVGSGIRPFVQTFGSDKLLFATAFFFGITVLTSLFIRPYRMKLESRTVKSVKAKRKSKFDSYLIAITIVICSMAFVSKFVDYQFKIMASNAYPTQDELVNFLDYFMQ